MNGEENNKIAIAFCKMTCEGAKGSVEGDLDRCIPQTGVGNDEYVTMDLFA